MHWYTPEFVKSISDDVPTVRNKNKGQDVNYRNHGYVWSSKANRSLLLPVSNAHYKALTASQYARCHKIKVYLQVKYYNVSNRTTLNGAPLKLWRVQILETAQHRWKSMFSAFRMRVAFPCVSPHILHCIAYNNMSNMGRYWWSFTAIRAHRLKIL